MWLLRFLMLLALIVWIGGIIFFAFVEAPTLFLILPTTRMAGDVVSVSLTKLHWMGLISGVIFLICSLRYNQIKHARFKPLAASHVFILLMLALTAYSQFSITPRIHQLRSEMAKADAWHDSDQIEFAALHQLSTWTEGGVLLLGLGVVVLTARRFGSN